MHHAVENIYHAIFYFFLQAKRRERVCAMASFSFFLFILKFLLHESHHCILYIPLNLSLLLCWYIFFTSPGLYNTLLRRLFCSVSKRGGCLPSGGRWCVRKKGPKSMWEKDLQNTMVPVIAPHQRKVFNFNFSIKRLASQIMFANYSNLPNILCKLDHILELHENSYNWHSFREMALNRPTTRSTRTWNLS